MKKGILVCDKWEKKERTFRLEAKEREIFVFQENK